MEGLRGHAKEKTNEPNEQKKKKNRGKQKRPTNLSKGHVGEESPRMSGNVDEERVKGVAELQYFRLERVLPLILPYLRGARQERGFGFSEFLAVQGRKENRGTCFGEPRGGTARRAP